MLFYILKRLALMLPTLLGALTITFAVIQFVPGGPVEQIMAEARAGEGGSYKAGRDSDAPAYSFGNLLQFHFKFGHAFSPW